MLQGCLIADIPIGLGIGIAPLLGSLSKEGDIQDVGFECVLKEAIRDALAQVGRLCASKKPLSRNDARVILMSQVLLSLSTQPVTSSDPIVEHEEELERAIDAVYDGAV